MNTKTDIEALMRPRYKVIADYPFSKSRVGDVFEMVIGRDEIWDNQRTGKRENINPKDFPALFKPLAWYEDREASEMPEYVKHKREFGGRVYKLSDAKESYGGINFMYDYPMTEHWVSLSECLPATESDYLQYINNQNKK